MIEFPRKDQDNQPQEPGRNDPCPCKSGKKYKKCCQKLKEFAESKPDITTILKLMYCLVKGLKGQGVIITKRTVDERVPDDWMNKMHFMPVVLGGQEIYKISVDKEPQPTIITQPKRIILSGQN